MSLIRVMSWLNYGSFLWPVSVGMICRTSGSVCTVYEDVVMESLLDVPTYHLYVRVHICHLLFEIAPGSLISADLFHDVG